MHSDEEIKDGRYFPSALEQSILMQTIEKYFQLPERSEDRSVVVQTVTRQLAEINPRWTNRAVRLWFNNNKRACLKSQVQFDPAQVRATNSVSAEQMPLKKRSLPPRSTSVGALLPSRPFSPPSDAGTSDTFFTSRNGEEDEVTGKLADIHTRFFKENTAVPSPLHPANEPAVVPRIDVLYHAIDCGVFVDRVPVVVGVDAQEKHRMLHVGDRAVEPGLTFPASSVAFDAVTNSFVIVAGNSLCQIGRDDLAIVAQAHLRITPMLKSAIAVSPDSILLGNRRHIFVWPRESLAHGVLDAAAVINPCLSAVTSLITMEGLVTAASWNYHAVHVLNSEGILVRTCLGHCAGVTSLCAFENGFLSGSADLTARLWDIRSQPPTATFYGHRAPITVVESATLDGVPFVLTGSEDHTVRIWDLRSQHALVETKVGSGIPIAISLTPDDEVKKRLSVLTKEKERTCAQGWQWPQVWNPPFGEQSPNVAMTCILGPLEFPI
jgi:hypothetical protein